MLTDAVRELGVGDRIVVRDVAELLLQSVVTTEETDTADRVGLKIDQEACHV